MMQVMLQHVSIPRPAGEENDQLARKFYGEVIGLTEKPVPSTIAHLGLIWFKLGDDAELHVFTESPKDTTSTRHFCLNVSDVETIRQALTQNDYEVTVPEAIQGRPRFFCRDPFHNLVEFTQIVDDYLKYQ